MQMQRCALVAPLTANSEMGPLSPTGSHSDFGSARGLVALGSSEAAPSACRRRGGGGGGIGGCLGILGIAAGLSGAELADALAEVFVAVSNPLREIGTSSNTASCCSVTVRVDDLDGDLAAFGSAPLGFGRLALVFARVGIAAGVSLNSRGSPSLALASATVSRVLFGFGNGPSSTPARIRAS